MKTFELIEQLEKIAPESMAAKWDNPGLLVGDNKEINKIMLAVDATDYVIDAAIENKVDIIITHHPLIFTGLKKVTCDDFIGRRILKLASNGIGLYAMHTNFDICQMNDIVRSKLGMTKMGIIEVVDSIFYEEAEELLDVGYGIYGFFGKEDDKESDSLITINELAEKVKDSFNIKSVRVFGDLTKKVSKVGVFPGSGKSAVDQAVSLGLEVLITGDIDHHAGIDAVAKGMCIIDAGHYGIEKIFVEYMKGYFEGEYPSIKIIDIMDDEPFVTI